MEIPPKPTVPPPKPPPQPTINDIIHKRLDDNDKKRVAIQDKLRKVCAEMLAEIDRVEERVSTELEQAFEKEDTRLQEIIQRTSEGDRMDDELLVNDYSICDTGKAIDKKISLTINKVEHPGVSGGNSTEKLKFISEQHQGSKVKAGEELSALCNALREEVETLKQRINTELEEKFNCEDKRLQSLLSGEYDEETIRTKLVVELLYYLNKNIKIDKISDRYELIVKHVISCFEKVFKIPTIKEIKHGKINLIIELVNTKCQELLDEVGIEEIFFCVLIWEEGTEPEESNHKYKVNKYDNSIAAYGLKAESTYLIKFRIESERTLSKWSESVKFTVPEFSECAWRECPANVSDDYKYVIDEKNHKIVTKDRSNFSTVIGSMSLPLNKVTSWSIKILKSYFNEDIFIGVAPFDINQNESHNYYKCGWYFSCFSSTLWSGPPHKYERKGYGLRKEKSEYIHAGDTVGVVMDTTKGELSFVLKGINYGVAFEGIPLDKPLVPCVVLKDRIPIELDTLFEVKENMNNSVSVPSNIIVKSGILWDSIIITWNNVQNSQFYQFEMNGFISGDAPTTNTFIKRGLLPDTEYSFRVRAVKNNTVSEWSGIAKGRTREALLENSWWKEYPMTPDWGFEYSVVEDNPRIATSIGMSTVIGNTPLTLNKVTSWSIKMLKSRDIDGGGILIGVAPFDINQNGDSGSCGWYFDCYKSTLCSGPPHKYSGKEYRPRKENGQYVHTGDTVGVIIDTTKGELSFILNGTNYGVAYEGIPLDKPLVPCVIFNYGDSVELITSPEVKVNTDTDKPDKSCVIS